MLLLEESNRDTRFPQAPSFFLDMAYLVLRTGKSGLNSVSAFEQLKKSLTITFLQRRHHAQPGNAPGYTFYDCNSLFS